MAAAVLTIIVTVVADLLAGEAQWHVVTVGAVAALVAALRIRMAGACRRLHQLVSGVIVAQPAVHAAAKLVPHGQIGQDLIDQLVHGDVFVTGTQLIVASTFVAMVSFSEHIVRAVVGVVGVAWIWIAVSEPPTKAKFRVRRAPAHAQMTSRYRPGMIPRRGPPRRSLTAT